MYMYMYIFIKNASHVADIIALPFWILCILYMYQKENKDIVENIMYFFFVSALICDSTFTFIFLNKNIR